MNQNNRKQCKWLITAIGQFALLDLLCVTLKLTQSKHCCFCWMQGSFAGTNYHGGQVGSLSLTFTQISSSGINMAQFSYVPAAIKFWARFSHRDRYNNSRECRGLLFNHTWRFSYILLYIRAKVLLCSYRSFLTLKNYWRIIHRFYLTA